MAFSLVNYLRKTYGIGVPPAYDDTTDLNAREAAIEKLSQDHDAETTPGRAMVEAETVADQRTALDVDSKAEVTAKAQDPANVQAAAVASAEVTAAPAHWWVLVGGALGRLTHVAWQTLVRAEIAPAIEAGTATTTPADTDKLGGVSTTHGLLYYTWANLKAAIYLKLYDWLIALTAKTTLADGDSLWIADAVGAASKKIAASLLMRRVKTPDGATAVYSVLSFSAITGYNGEGNTLSIVSNNLRCAWSGSGPNRFYHYPGTPKALSGKVVYARVRGSRNGIVVQGYNSLSGPFFGTFTLATDWQIVLFILPVNSSYWGLYQTAANCVSGDYFEINNVWIGDYSYLPGSGSEEGIRILDQLGDTPGTPQAASGTITSNGTNVSNGDTVTIGGKVYTFRGSAYWAAGNLVEGDVLIGANASESMSALGWAIRRYNNGSMDNVWYKIAAPHPLVYSSINYPILSIYAGTTTGADVRTSTTGIRGNNITLAKSAVTLTLSSSTLTGGIDDAGAKLSRQVALSSQQLAVKTSGVQVDYEMLLDSEDGFIKKKVLKSNLESATQSAGKRALFNAGAGLNANHIQFPATQVASSDPNAFDDYREIDAVVNDLSGAGLTITINSAKATKIGRQVFLNYDLVWPTTVDTSAAKISVPITASAPGGGKVVNSTIPISIDVLVNTSVLYFVNSSGSASITNTQLSGKRIYLQAAYTA